MATPTGVHGTPPALCTAYVYQAPARVSTGESSHLGAIPLSIGVLGPTAGSRPTEGGRGAAEPSLRGRTAALAASSLYAQRNVRARRGRVNIVAGVSGAKAEAEPSEPLRRSRAPTGNPRPQRSPPTRHPPLPRSSPRLLPWSPTAPPCAGPAHRASGPGPSVILVPRHGNPRPSVPRTRQPNALNFGSKWLTLENESAAPRS